MDSVVYLDPEIWDLIFGYLHNWGARPILFVLCRRMKQLITDYPCHYSPAINNAAKRNLKELLNWMVAQGVPITNGTLAQAAAGGHLDLLKESLGRTINIVVKAAAAAYGQTEVLEYLKLQNCIFTNSTAKCAVEMGDMKVMEHLNTTGYLMKDNNTVIAAARTCQRNMVEWLLSKGCMLPSGAIQAAACKGNMDFILWLYSNGCKPNSDTWLGAAQGGHKHVCEWLYELEIEIPWLTSAYAAGGGNVELLEWLVNHGCSATTEAYIYAAESGHLECIKWIKLNTECPMPAELAKTAGRYGYMHIVEWATQHGCHYY